MKQRRVENQRFFLVFSAIAGSFPSDHKYEAPALSGRPCRGPQHAQVWEQQGRVLMGQQLGCRGRASVPLTLARQRLTSSSGADGPGPSSAPLLPYY